MKNLKTELVFIIDKSGSMHSLADDTVGGFNSMLKKQKEEEGEAFVTTYLFNQELSLLHDRLPLDKVAEMESVDYRPHGCTALLDAVGAAVEHIQSIHRYLRPEDVPSRTLFIIITDGMENASHVFSYQKVTELIEKKKKKGWEFLFLAANIDAAKAASSIGISSDRAVRYTATTDGTEEVYDVVSDAVCYMRASRCVSDHWADKLKKKK